MSNPFSQIRLLANTRAEMLSQMHKLNEVIDSLVKLIQIESRGKIITFDEALLINNHGYAKCLKNGIIILSSGTGITLKCAGMEAIDMISFQLWRGSYTSENIPNFKNAQS